MLTHIGYIGYGFVGKACHKAFEHNATAIIIDPLYTQTTINDLQADNPPIVFVSINAPTLSNNNVDASVIYEIFTQLAGIHYKGLVVLKSTLPPDIVHDLYKVFADKSACNPLRYIYSPEFLREAEWEEDALNPYMIIMAGHHNDCSELESIYRRHSHINQDMSYCIMGYKEAALVKYAINTYLATKVVFMNQLYRLYADMDDGHPVHPETWRNFVNTISLDLRIGNSHMDVPGADNRFGYGGKCFPKDVRALLGFDKQNRLSVLKEVDIANVFARI